MSIYADNDNVTMDVYTAIQIYEYLEDLKNYIIDHCYECEKCPECLDEDHVEDNCIYYEKKSSINYDSYILKSAIDKIIVKPK